MVQSVAGVSPDANVGLLAEIAAVYGGFGRWEGLVREFRPSLVLVPTSSGGALVTCGHGGVQWFLAFTREQDLAEWAVARGRRPDADVDFLTVLGERLLDVAVPSVDGPAGVALNIAGRRPIFLPPQGVASEILSDSQVETR